MKKHLLRGCVWAGLIALQSAAGTFSLNSVKGLWQFNGNLDPYWECQSAADAAGFTIDGAPGSAYGATSQMVWLDLRSDDPPHGGLVTGESLVFPHAAAPNGPVGSACVNNWTMMMDVRIPTNAQDSALVRSAATLGDADIFLNVGKQIVFQNANGPSGLHPVASGPLPTNTWVRLTFSSGYDSGSGRIILHAYVNGLETPQSASGDLWTTPDGHFGLDPTAFSLFSQSGMPSGCVPPIEVNSVAFWGHRLNGADIATLGGSDADGINWDDMTPPDGWPPLPPLNGKLMFGTFEAHYTPDMAAIAATATSSWEPDIVANVTIDLGEDGGRIPGMPDHTFGGTVDAYILTNGTAVATEQVSVNHSPANEADVAEMAGVTIERVEALHLTIHGATGYVIVYLPAGFGVADSIQHALLRDCTRPIEYALNERLEPADNTIMLSRDLFDFSANGSLYPVLDRVPLRFTTPQIKWLTQAGTFEFDQAQVTTPLYTRLPQMQIVAEQQDAGWPGAAIVPPSNDGYFIAANVPQGAPVVVKARPEGAASVENLLVSLDATALGGDYTGFATHYPVMSVRWTGTESQLCFVEDAVDCSSSRLRGSLVSSTSYRRAVPDAAGMCAAPPEPIPDENVFFSAGEDMWFFTPDGGLYAFGQVSSLPVFEWESFTPFMLEWGGFRDTNGVVKFAHAIITNAPAQGGFDYGEVLTSGTAVRNNDALVAALPERQRVAAILLTGFGEEFHRVERPGTEAYYEGLAEYPGINLHGYGHSSAVTAKSIIAGVEVSPPGYTLAPAAKYCVRPGGVSGLHIAASDSADITFQAYGSDFVLTRLKLSYLDGENVESGVGGGLSVRKPADFSLTFERLILGKKGELASAGVAEGQKPTLGPFAWMLKFTPLTLDFPQASGCPPPQPDEGFIRIGMSAALPGLGGGEFFGNLGFLDGDLVTESLPLRNNEPVAKGIENVSRFLPGNLLSIAGTPETGNKPWNINPVTGISLNRWGDEQYADGTLTVGGLLDVPFFVDMPVILSTGSMNTGARPALYVRSNRNWAPLDDVVFDPDHLGYPGNTTLGNYRAEDIHDPVAQRDWQDLIRFELPVKMDADSVIRSRNPVKDQPLMIFDLTETVRAMTPEAAEITLDGRSIDKYEDLAKQVNVSTLLGNSQLIDASPEVQKAIDGALTCVRSLDDILADHSHPLLDPGLALLAQQEATTSFFQQLKDAQDSNERKGLLDSRVGDASGGLTYGVLGMFNADSEDPQYSLNGQWRRDIAGPVSNACAGLRDFAALADGAEQVTALAESLAARMGLPGGASAPDAARLQALAALLHQAVLRLDNVAEALGPDGELTLAMTAALEDADAVKPIVQRAINDLKSKWAPSDPSKAAALYKANGAEAAFKQELADALADRFAESAFAGSCLTLLRQYVADPQTLARQGLDDTLRMACQLVADASEPDEPIKARGALGDYLKANRLRGYARISGDSLHELRLDGELTLQAHELMPKQKFDGWCLMRDVDSGTPGTDNISEGGITAEILAGASTELEWGPQYVEMTLGAKIGLNATGDPVSFMGDMALDGRIDLCAITINTLKLGVGIGPDDAYFYGRTAGRVGDMKVAVGVFFGKTQDIEILKIADRDFGSVLSAMKLDMPVTGALAYSEGDMSLLPLIGIPPSCLLDLRVGGGQGFCALVKDTDVIAGFKIAESVTGELLCICNVTGRFGSVLTGMADFGVVFEEPEISTKYLYTFRSLSGRAWTTLEGEVGYDPFSYSFSKTLGLTLQFNDKGKITWDVDY